MILAVTAGPARCGVPKFPRQASWVVALLAPGLALAQPSAPQNPGQLNAARIAALEGQVARLSGSIEELQRRPSERLLLAALNLQAALQTSRPYQREWQALRDTAPDGALPEPFAAVLTSHAARGLATTTELRESFLLLAPTLSASAPAEQSWLEWGRLWLQNLLAVIGFAEPPPPSPAAATIANVSHLLARGQIAPALADVETLDARMQPFVTGWVAQARARVAAEQAVQETILRAFAQLGAHHGAAR